MGKRLFTMLKSNTQGERYGKYRGYPYHIKQSGMTIVYSKRKGSHKAIWEDTNFDKAMGHVLKKTYF